MKIANAVFLLASLSGANAETSFLRASISNGPLTCLGGCADEAVTTGKKKHPTKNKIYKTAQACVSDCLPNTARKSATVSCSLKCFKKQASSVAKIADKALEKEISKCKSKCSGEDDVDKCEKKCDKSSSKSVVKAVNKSGSKLTDAAKKCLGGCVSGEDVDFMMDFYDFDFKEEDTSSGDTSEDTSDDSSEDTSSSNSGDTRTSSKCITKPAIRDTKAKCEDVKGCEWNGQKCQDKSEFDFDFKEEDTSSEDTSEDTSDSTSSSNSGDTRTSSKCTSDYKNNQDKCEASSKCSWNASKGKCEDKEKYVVDKEAVTAFA